MKTEQEIIERREQIKSSIREILNDHSTAAYDETYYRKLCVQRDTLKWVLEDQP